MTDTQIGLFDMGLEASTKTGAENFIDSAGERLAKLEWHSESRKGLYYDELDYRKLCSLTVELKGIRKLDKKGKFKFYLERYWHYSELEEIIADEVSCKNIDELEKVFESEKDNFECLRSLPDDVLFDGRRYCWKFEVNDGIIYFTEKWLSSLD